MDAPQGGILCFPDPAEEVWHDEGEHDGLLQQRFGRLQPGDILPPHARVVADYLPGDLGQVIYFITVNIGYYDTDGDCKRCHITRFSYIAYQII